MSSAFDVPPLALASVAPGWLRTPTSPVGICVLSTSLTSGVAGGVEGGVDAGRLVVGVGVFALDGAG